MIRSMSTGFPLSSVSLALFHAQKLALTADIPSRKSRQRKRCCFATMNEGTFASTTAFELFDLS